VTAKPLIGKDVERSSRAHFEAMCRNLLKRFVENCYNTTYSHPLGHDLNSLFPEFEGQGGGYIPYCDFRH